MPIVEDTCETPPEKQPNPIEVFKPSFKTVVVDTRYEPATALLTHLEGAAWTVNYYSQVLDTDNALSGQNMDRSAPYQQYKLIENMVLRVTTPLSQTQDVGTKSFSLTGQATVTPCGLVANEGDMFLASLDDGRSGVFRVTLSEQRSIYKDAAYIIDYILIDYATEERMKDLTEKVVETLTYVSDFLMHGQNPLINTNDYQIIRKLNGLFIDIANDYFYRYVSKEYRALIIPGQDYPIYDSFLTHAVLRAFDSEDGVDFRKIKEFNVGANDGLAVKTIWDVLLNKKRYLLKGAMKQFGLASVVNFSSDAMQESVRFSGVTFIIYPTDAVMSEDSIRQKEMTLISDVNLQYTNSRLTDLRELISLKKLNGLPELKLPAINHMKDSTYVLSEAFYNRYPIGQSMLELLVNDYLDDKSINLQTLYDLSETAMSWPLLEQFYQIPILLMLIRAAVRRM